MHPRKQGTFLCVCGWIVTGGVSQQKDTSENWHLTSAKEMSNSSSKRNYVRGTADIPPHLTDTS
jgi:hypothetical protein